MDDFEVALAPSATGILQCLKLLAAEAASLKLLRTLSAIEDALETAVTESGMETDEESVTLPVLH